MAKQSKATIEKRKAQLLEIGYSENDIDPGLAAMIESDNAKTWDKLFLDLKKKKEAEIPFTEAEHIEEVQQPVGETKAIDLFKKRELAAFESNPLVVAIAEFEKKYKGLTFKSLEDKTGIEALKAAKKTVQKTRTFVTKHEETLKAPYLSHLNEIRAVSKKFQAMIEPIETPLDTELDRLKELETAEEIRVKAEEEKEINRRIDLLKACGMKFDGSFYCIAERSMDIGTIKAMTPEAFDDLVEKVKGDKKRLDDEEAKRLEDMKKERLSTRGNMLLTLGMTFTELDGKDGNYTSEHLPGVTVLTVCLTDEADDTFMKLFSSLSTRINDAKVKAKDEADKKAKERTVALRSKLIIATGMNRVDWIPGSTQAGFYFKNEFIECYLTLPDVGNMSDEAFDTLLEGFELRISEAKAAAVKKEEDDAKVRQLAQDRGQQLVALGLTSAPKLASYIFTLPDATTQCSVAYGELTGYSPEKWGNTINQVTEIITIIKREQQAFEDKAAKDKKDREEKEAKDAMTFQQRQYDLVNLKMVIVGGEFIIKNEYGFSVKISIEEVKAIDEDMWPAKLTEITGLVANLIKHTEEQRQAKIDEAEALKPKVQRVNEFANSIDVAMGEMPVVNDENLNKALATFGKKVSDAIAELRFCIIENK